jgi:hypothetical protein
VSGDEGQRVGLQRAGVVQLRGGQHFAHICGRQICWTGTRAEVL